MLLQVRLVPPLDSRPSFFRFSGLSSPIPWFSSPTSFPVDVPMTLVILDGRRLLHPFSPSFGSRLGKKDLTSFTEPSNIYHRCSPSSTIIDYCTCGVDRKNPVLSPHYQTFVITPRLTKRSEVPGSVAPSLSSTVYSVDVSFGVRTPLRGRLYSLTSPEGLFYSSYLS